MTQFPGAPERPTGHEPSASQGSELDEENFGSLLEAVADAVVEANPDRVAVISGRCHRTWADLDRRAAQLAGYLAGAGVSQGVRVGIGLYNSVEYIETLFAVFKLRAVPVNVNYRYREAELQQILNYTRVAAVVVDESLRDRVERIAPQVPSLRAVVCVRRSGTADSAVMPGPLVVDYDVAVDGPPLPRQPRSGDDEIIILTGGTTGQPKGVVWNHTRLCARASSVHRRVGWPVPQNRAELVAAAARAVASESAPVMMPVSPLMHGTGFFFSLGNLLLGGQIVCLTGRSLDPAEVWQQVQAHRVHEMAIVGDAFAKPMLAELWEAAGQGRPYDITSLRRIVSSGVLWSVETKKSLLKAGRMTLQDSIASSEGGPYGVSMAGPDPESVSARFVLPPNARVIAADGTDVVPGSGQVGELASSGVLPLGYLNDPELTAAVFRVIDGIRYAVPGDVATLESDGTLTLLGRGSGVINTGGEKVFVEEVEQALLTHPGVDEVVVVGVSDERWGSRVTALVHPAAGQRPTVDELAAHIGATLARYKRPQQVFFVDEIERTASGKPDRRWAQECAGQLAAASTQ